MAGGYGAYYYTYTAWDVLRPNDTPPGYAYFHHLREFFEGTDFWLLTPADDLVSQGFCLANPGREYVVFLDHPATFKLRVAGLQTPAATEWFHPYTDRRTRAGDLGNGIQSLTPPVSWGDEPVVLHVGQPGAAQTSQHDLHH
jgi:hypothetical protein